MGAEEWKRLCINYFKSSNATEQDWDELASVMLDASEDGLLTDKLEKSIDPSVDLDRTDWDW
jgi:hypothetical protein